jgi:hypothetical protein
MHTIDGLKDKFPVKIDVPINFSLYFNLQFKGLNFDNINNQKLSIYSNLNKSQEKNSRTSSRARKNIGHYCLHMIQLKQHISLTKILIFIFSQSTIKTTSTSNY